MSANAREGIDRLIDPASIAICGLSARPEKHGARTLGYLRRFGYRGEIWGVNPSLPEIEGVEVFAAVADLPAAPDLVVMALPAAVAAREVTACAELGAGGVLIYAGGFAEAGEGGLRLQREMVAAVAGTPTRLVGPNSAGLINPGARMAASFLTCLERPAEELRPSPVALISQSGGLMSYLHNVAAASGGGLAFSVSTGNEADLGVPDFLEYAVEQDDVEAVALVLETVRDGRRFRAAAERARAEGKPVVVFKLGRGATGARMMAGHTGAVASPDRTFRAVCDSLGLIRADSIPELFEIARLVAGAGRPRAKGVGILTHSGGHAIMAADVADELGLALPQPSEPVVAALEGYVEMGTAANPADLGGIVGNPGRFADAVETFMREPAFGVAIAVSSPHPPSDSESRAAALAQLASGSADRPILINVWSAGDVNRVGLDLLRSRGARVTESIFAALKAARALVAAGEMPPPGPEEDDREPVEAAIAELESLGSRHGVLSESESKRILAALDFPLMPERKAHSRREALAAAAEIGYPAVLKFEVEGLAHKSEAGAVRLDLRDADALAAAWDEMSASLAERFGAPGTGLVSAYRPGTEVILGATVDAAFGPLVAVGLGGVGVEVLGDVNLALAPLSRPAAAEAVSRLRAVELLRGYRGSPACDLDRLAALLARLSAFVARAPDRVREIDINPLIYTAEGWRAADALIRIGSDDEQDSSSV